MAFSGGLSCFQLRGRSTPPNAFGVGDDDNALFPFMGSQQNVTDAGDGSDIKSFRAWLESLDRDGRNESCRHLQRKRRSIHSLVGQANASFSINDHIAP